MIVLEESVAFLSSRNPGVAVLPKGHAARHGPVVLKDLKELVQPVDSTDSVQEPRRAGGSPGPVRVRDLTVLIVNGNFPQVETRGALHTDSHAVSGDSVLGEQIVANEKVARHLRIIVQENNYKRSKKRNVRLV